jgi:hypothetical protein
MKICCDLIPLIFKLANNDVKFKILHLSLNSTKFIIHYLPFINPSVVGKIFNNKLFDAIINVEIHLKNINLNALIDDNVEANELKKIININEYYYELAKECFINCNPHIIKIKGVNHTFNDLNANILHRMKTFEQIIFAANYLSNYYYYNEISDDKFWNNDKDLKEKFLYRWYFNTAILKSYKFNDFNKKYGSFSDLFNLTTYNSKYWLFIKKILYVNKTIKNLHLHPENIFKIINLTINSTDPDDIIIFNNCITKIKFCSNPEHQVTCNCDNKSKLRMNFSDENKFMILLCQKSRYDLLKIFVDYYHAKINIHSLLNLMKFDSKCAYIVMSYIDFKHYLLYRILMAIQFNQKDFALRLSDEINCLDELYINEIFLQACYYHNIELMNKLINKYKKILLFDHALIISINKKYSDIITLILKNYQIENLIILRNNIGFNGCSLMFNFMESNAPNDGFYRNYKSYTKNEIISKIKFII